MILNTVPLTRSDTGNKSGIQLYRCRRHEIVLILYSGLPYKFENLPT
jgi:hypothetical protein